MIRLLCLSCLLALTACGYGVRRDEIFTPLEIGVADMLYVGDVPSSRLGQFLAVLGDNRISARDGGSLGNGSHRVLVREDQMKKFSAFVRSHEGAMAQHGVRLRTR